jgi:amino acid transporter
VLATIIVLSNLAGVAVQFLYQFIGSAVNSEMVSGLWENPLINVATCLVFLAIATYVAYRGIDTTEHVQMVLVIFQLVMLLVFSVMAIARSSASEVGEAFSLSWFSPAGLTLSAFIAGLSGSIFAFWGWDTSLTVNEESKDSDTNPGRAALLCVLSILLTYLLVSVATQMYAGLGDTGLGLTNPEISDNGLVLILGLGLILAGLVIMAILRVRQPAFFRGETIIHESAHEMRPHEHLVA